MHMPGCDNPTDHLASTLGGLNLGDAEGGSSSREPGPSSSGVTVAAGGGQRAVTAPSADRPGLLTCQLLSCLATTGKNGAPLLTCAGCGYVAYCCKDHQKLDWSLHKHFCKNVGKDGPLAPVVPDAEWMTEGMNDEQVCQWAAACHDLKILGDMARGGHHAAAVVRAKAVISDFESLYGRGHLGTVYTLGSVTLLFIERAMYDDALSYSLRVLKIVEDRFGPDDIRTASYLSHYANVIHGLGRNMEALVQHQRCLRISESARGLNSDATAIDLNNIASTLCDLGRFDEAVPLIHRCIAIKTALEGAASQRDGLATSRSNLADALGRLGRFDEARPLFEHELKSTEMAKGRNSVDYAHVSAKYAVVMHKCGQGEPAVIVDMLEHAARVLESIHGERDLIFITILGNGARVNAELGRWRRAADQMERCATLTSDEYGPGHALTKEARKKAALYKSRR